MNKVCVDKIDLSKPVCVSIEGNISAAKSTFLKVLESHLGAENIEYFCEPVNLWTNCYGQNLLEAFYKDPKRYSYMFQSAAIATRLIQQNKPQTRPIRILERSGLSDHCFAENCRDTGLMNDVEFAAYQTWYNFLIKHSSGPNGLIYLRTTPDVCFERMGRRNRQEESKVSLEYLQQIHDKHEKWFPKDKTRDKVLDLPFVVIDGNLEFESCDDRQTEIVKSVVDFIADLQKKF